MASALTSIPVALLLCVPGAWPFPWPREKIAHYTAYRADGPIAIDGSLDEINSLGTIYEVFVWEEAYEAAGYAKVAELDRQQPGVRPFKGVGFRNHPRGPRIGYWSWDSHVPEVFPFIHFSTRPVSEAAGLPPGSGPRPGAP